MKGTKEDAINIVTVLNESGHTAYLAGGCVRDLLLRREPGDYDVATSATPEEVQKTFVRTIPVGISFGVVKVVQDGRETDVATFRVDGQYSDNRRPDTVTLTASAEEDVRRRDFTINGMLMDAQEQVFDYVGGQYDIESKTIRTIGNAEERFTEDPLRMMRAIRFAVKYNFDIAPDTWNMLCHLASTIKVISAERVTDELSKMFTCGNSEKAFILLRRSGLWNAWFGCTTSHDDSWRCLEPLSKMTPQDPFIMALGFILYYSFEIGRENHLKALRLTNEQLAGFNTLLVHAREHTHFMGKGQADQRKQMQWDDLSLVERFIDYQGIDSTCHYNYHAGDGLAGILARKQQIKLMGWPSALINGKWLIDHGYVPGVAFTPMLEAVRTEQLNEHLAFEQDVLTFLGAHFPCAPRMIDGVLVDKMRPTRVCAPCRCGLTMSAEVPRDPKGRWQWRDRENEVNIRYVSNSFVECGTCNGKRAKKAFTEIVL